MSQTLAQPPDVTLYVLRWRRRAAHSWNSEAPWTVETFPTHKEARRRLDELNAMKSMEAQTHGGRRGIYFFNWS